MKFVLSIRVLPGMDVQQFEIPLDLAGAGTLKIQPGAEGIGHKITILAEDGGLRAWYAHDLISLHFE